MANGTERVNEAKLAGAARHLLEGGLIAVAWTGVALAAIFLGLRCYARWREAARLFFDDYWMIAAFAFLFANAVLQTLQAHSLYYLVDLAAGRVKEGPELLVQGNRYVRYEFVIIAFFWTVTWCVKGSFLALYYRLFDGLPRYRNMWYACVVFTFGAYVGCWMASVWTCHPPSTYFQFGIAAQLSTRYRCANPDRRSLQQTCRQHRVRSSPSPTARQSTSSRT